MAAAAPDTWMPLWIGPYLANTLHLNRAQHGSYCLLIMACWKAGGRLPANDETLATIARCSAKEWKAERAIFAAFFEIDGEWWAHERVMIELDKARAFVSQRSDAGKASAEQRKRQREGNEHATDGQRDGQREGKTSPTPSPSVTTTPSLASSARARLIPDDWLPSDDDIAQVRKGRPDIVGAVYDRRMADFRDWCKANAVTSHDFASTWRGFMRRTDAPKEARFAKPDPQALPASEPWEQRLSGWRSSKQWLPQIWGPPPGEPGCRAPKHLTGGAV